VAGIPYFVDSNFLSSCPSRFLSGHSSVYIARSIVLFFLEICPDYWGNQIQSHLCSIVEGNTGITVSLPLHI